MTDFIRTEKCELYCPFCNKAHKGKIGYCGDEGCGGHGIVSSDNCNFVKELDKASGDKIEQRLAEFEQKYNKPQTRE